MYFWPYSLTIADCNITVVCVGLDPIHCVCFDHSLVCYNFLLLQQWRSILCALQGLFGPTYGFVLMSLGLMSVPCAAKQANHSGICAYLSTHILAYTLVNSLTWSTSVEWHFCYLLHKADTQLTNIHLKIWAH
jgi:hypothetical protein